MVLGLIFILVRQCLFTSLDWPRTHYIDQAGLGLTEIYLSVPLGLKACKSCSSKFVSFFRSWKICFVYLFMGEYIQMFRKTTLYVCNELKYLGNFVRLRLTPNQSVSKWYSFLSNNTRFLSRIWFVNQIYRFFILKWIYIINKFYTNCWYKF